jgi:hypothetical protein
MKVGRVTHAIIIRAVRLAHASPALRRVLVSVLNRAPSLKRHLKRATVDAMSSRSIIAPSEMAEDALLSPLAKRVMRDIRRRRASQDAALDSSRSAKG